MPCIQPNPLGSKFPYEIVLNGSQESPWKRVSGCLEDLLGKLIPEGYQDRAGFHYGSSESNRED